ncbi:MAG: hypothetical protein JAZ15_04735, partial [Candidatus Thiodiazotropha endolucinida]|nr:hypothetical protein [Candidatus Thiodiazotropha taylori]MCW4312306.1 hypothetical protein [Candidatus Thiodiazotropha taylori]
DLAIWRFGDLAILLRIYDLAQSCKEESLLIDMNQIPIHMLRACYKSGSIHNGQHFLGNLRSEKLADLPNNSIVKMVPIPIQSA